MIILERLCSKIITHVTTQTTFDHYPVVACVDDSIVNRKMMARLLQRTHCSTQSFVHGTTLDKIKHFPQSVLNHPDGVEVCIIDQNLDDPSGIHASIRGTDLVQQLMQRGFKGKCFIRSANDSPADVDHYRQLGAGFISKTVNDPATFIQTLESPVDVHLKDVLVECDEDDLDDIKEDIAAKYHKALQVYHCSSVDPTDPRAGGMDPTDPRASINMEKFWKIVHQLKGDVMAMGLLTLGRTCEAFRHLPKHPANCDEYAKPLTDFQQEFAAVLSQWNVPTHV